MFITHTLSKQDFRTTKQTPDEASTKKIEYIKTKLENMNPSQRNFMLDAINQLLEGSATVNILLPSGPQTTCGRPKSQGKSKFRGKKMKSDCWQPSEFKIIAKQHRAEEMETENKKKQKTQNPTIKEEVKTQIQPSRKTPLKKEEPKEKKKVKFSVPDDKKDGSVKPKSTRPPV
jgi:hypothetical protein